MMEQMFKSQTIALKFEQLSGFMNIKNGAAKAQKIAQNIEEAYFDKFIKPKGVKNNITGKTKTQLMVKILVMKVMI